MAGEVRRMMAAGSETWSRVGTGRLGFLNYSIPGVGGKGCET
jgi:hypothetical protein